MFLNKGRAGRTTLDLGGKESLIDLKVLATDGGDPSNERFKVSAGSS